MGLFDAVGDLVGEITGGNRMAEAAGAAAIAQQQTSQAERDLIIKEGREQQKLAMDLAGATPQELQAYEQQLTSSMKQIDTRQRMIDAIDPALMEASEQVLALLQGEEAGSTKVANKQRERQRIELVNSLRSQYGPGAESSSIGRRILDQFDSETSVTTQTNQQNALAQVFGIASAAPGLTNMNNEISAMQSAGSSFGVLQNRKLNTQMQTGSNILAGISGTSQNIVGSAGAQYVESQAKGQNQMNFMNSLIEAGATVAAGKAG